jgi:hypothetical protein
MFYVNMRIGILHVSSINGRHTVVTIICQTDKSCRFRQKQPGLVDHLGECRFGRVSVEIFIA